MRTAGVSRITSRLRTAGVLRIAPRLRIVQVSWIVPWLRTPGVSWSALSAARCSGSCGSPLSSALLGVSRTIPQLPLLGSHGPPLGFHRESPPGITPDLLAVGTARCGDLCPTHLVVGQSQSGMRRVAANVSGLLWQKCEFQTQVVPRSSWFGGLAGPFSLPRTEWRWVRRGLQQAADRLDRPPRSRWLPWH